MDMTFKAAEEKALDYVAKMRGMDKERVREELNLVFTPNMYKEWVGEWQRGERP